jgi:hypothetical protein
MSDKPDIEAIRLRNEERKAGGGCGPRKVGCDFDDHYQCVHHSPTWADIDVLLAEIEARDAEIERLRAEIAVDDKLLAERNRILEAEPCPMHGPCVPHVLEVLGGTDQHGTIGK